MNVTGPEFVIEDGPSTPLLGGGSGVTSRDKVRLSTLEACAYGQTVSKGELK